MKFYSRFILLAVFFIAASFGSFKIAHANITSNLVGDWALDNGSGTSATDSSGISNHGILTAISAASPAWVSGLIGTNALTFASGDGAGGYLKITSTSSTAINNIWATGGTVSFWTKINSAGPSSAGFWFDKASKWTIKAPGVPSTNATSTGIELNIKWSGGTTLVWRNAFSVPFGSWHHIVITYNGSATSNNPTFYVDGMASSPTLVTGTTTGTIADDSSNNISVGSNTAGSRILDGQMDEVRIYNRALSAADVTLLFQQAAPTVSAQAVTNIAQTTATFNGSIDSIGSSNVTIRGFSYGLTTSYGTTATTSGTYGTGAFTLNATGLVCNTLYHYKALATNTGGTASSTDATFSTAVCSPILTTSSASSIASTTATLNGNITSTGGENPATRGFTYGLTTAYGATTTESGSFSTGAYTGSATGLTPNTIYHFRSYATNSLGTAYGNDTTLTTLLSYPLDIAEVNRFSTTSNSVASGVAITVSLTGGISSGKTAVVMIGWEAPSTLSISSITDSKGNSWTIQNSNLIATVHQMAVMSSFVGTSLTTSDTITITFSNSAIVTTQYSGTVISFTGGDVSNTPNVIKSGSGFGTSISFPGLTTLANTLIVGFVQVQQTSVYSAPAWSQLGVNTSFGQSDTTVGLTNTYLYQPAPDIGSYDPGGVIAPIESWHAIWMAFNPFVSGGGATAPSVTTSAASSVAQTGGTLNGSITATNGADATQSGFAYGTSATLATVIATSTLGSQSGTASFTSSLSSLSCNTTYYFRAYATNTGGTGFGSITSFTTSACAPTVTTSAATLVATSTATFTGNITATGGANATQSGFAYGTSATLATVISTTTLGSFSGTGSFTQNITGLAQGTVYYVRTYATNTGGTSFGSIQTFTTSAVTVPTLTIQSASSILATSATLNGTITGDGNASTTIRGFAYGTSLAYGATTTSSGTFNLGTYTGNASSLTCNTAYHIKAYATNEAGTGYSSDTTFVTAACSATVTTSAASLVATSTATLNGNVTATGGSDATEHGFAYGTVSTLSSVIATTTSGAFSGTGAFTQGITGLSPNTTYYARAYSINTGGTAFGSIQSFTTNAITVPTLTIQAASSLLATSATLNGTITADGNASSTVRGFAYGLTTVYGATTTSSGNFNLGTYTANISSLTCNTIYHVKAYATNAAGAGYSSDTTFTTTACIPGTPTSVHAVSGNGQAVISFSAPADNGGASINGYTVTSNPGGFNATSASSPITVTGLTNGTSYTFSVVATNNVGDSLVSASSNAITPSTTPTISTSAASSIDTTIATLNANLTSTGGGSISQHGFAYGTVSTLATVLSTSTLGTVSGIGTFGQDLTGLSNSTTYYFRAYAINDAGTKLGSIQSFTTDALSPPTISDSSATSIAQTAATLNGSIIDTGGDTPTVRGFEWGSDVSYGTIVSTTGSYSIGSFTADISDLTCNSTYYYRAFATNSIGTASSTGQSFTTSACDVSAPAAPQNTRPRVSSGSSAAGQVSNLLSQGFIGQAEQIANQFGIVFPQTTVPGVLVSPSPQIIQKSFTRPLELGVAGNDVKVLQQFLNSHGFVISKTGPGSVGRETNQFGGLTQAALIRFQKAKGITPAVGYLGPITKAAILAEVNANPNPSPLQNQNPVQNQGQASITKALQSGMQDPQVSVLQKFLTSMPDIYPSGLVTGFFGQQTRQAVQAFQLKYGIVTSTSDSGYGIVGPATRKKIEELK